MCNMIWIIFITINFWQYWQAACQLQLPAVAGAGGAAPPPPPPPPPGRGFQLKCSDEYAKADITDPAIVQEFMENAPPGHHILSVDPCIYPGKNAHRFIVKYTSDNFRRCEDIRRVYNDMNTYKPQNSNVGLIAVVPGGYMVEYKQFCMCYRRAFRRRRGIINAFGIDRLTHDTGSTPMRYYFANRPTTLSGNVIKCDDHDFTCGPQKF